MLSAAHTVSSIRTWRNCRRLYRYRYRDNVRPAGKGKALHVGTGFHNGLEAFGEGLSIYAALAMITTDAEEWWGTDKGRVELARTRAMLRAYYWRWEDTRADWECIETEGEFETELPNGARLAGKRDAVWRYKDGRIYLVEHKTTSDEVDNVGTDYWRRLAFDSQLDAYLYDLSQRHDETPSIIYDVVLKPSSQSKPKMKTKVAKRKSETDEQFAERKAAVMETLDEFEERLYCQMIADPDEYLVRREVHRTADQHKQAIEELSETAAEIDNYSGTYPRNDSACSARYGMCPYLDVCGGTESLDSERFVQLKTSHPELSGNNTKEATNDNISDCPI